MPGGGSILGMIISLKNNSRSKIRVFDMLRENQRLIRGLKKDLHFKKVSEEEIKEIKQEIKIRAKSQRIIQLLFAIPFILLIVTITTLIWVDMKRDLHQEELLRIEQEKEKQQRVYEEYLWELNEGYNWLAKENYKAAKFYFFNAYSMRPNDYTSNVSLTTAFMYDCIKNKIKCDTSITLLMNLDASFQEKKEVIDLMNYYSENKELFTEAKTP